MSPEPVTVAVISWNTRELLARCLRSLRPDVEAGRASVWVVDNGSRDGSPEMVAHEFEWAFLLASDGNLGFGPAVNLVAERSAGPWIAPANADIELMPGALETLLAAAEGDPEAGALAPRLILPDGSTQHSVHPFPSVSLALAFNFGLSRLVPGLGERLCLPGRWDADRPRYVDWTHGAFLLVRRAAFDAVGGFDSRQWMYAEDLDLAWRLAHGGWSVRYEPSALVRHESGAATALAFAGSKDERHITAAYAWMERRRGRIFARLYAAINCLGAILRWTPLSVAALVAPQRFSARRTRARRYAELHRLGLRHREVPAGPAGQQGADRLHSLR